MLLLRRAPLRVAPSLCYVVAFGCFEGLVAFQISYRSSSGRRISCPLQYADDRHRHHQKEHKQQDGGSEEEKRGEEPPSGLLQHFPSKGSMFFPNIGVETSQEWQDSFIRNGIADFVPPVADAQSLDCLVLGGDDDGGSSDANVLYGKVMSDQAQSEQRRILQTAHRESGNSSDENDEAVKITTTGSDANLDHRPSFDCILDRGLMDALLGASSFSAAPTGSEYVFRSGCAVGTSTSYRHNSADCNNTSTTSAESNILIPLLLQEASRQVREHGIFVMTTRTEVLTPTVKYYLTVLGQSLGMQWKFGLDGISDSATSVSVARRFFAGTLPSFGQLTLVHHSLLQSSLSLPRTSDAF